MIYPKHRKSFAKRVLLMTAMLLSLLAIADTFAAEYWAPRNSDKYHLPTCKLVEKIKPENLLIFRSPERAQKVGYKPCEICKPPGASKPVITQTIQKKEIVEPQKKDTFAAEYWAPRNSDKYHLPTCKLVEKIKPENLLIFRSPERAQKVGYKPCEICKPPGASKTAKEQTIQKKEAVEPQKTEIVQDKRTTKEEWSEKGFARWQVGDYLGAIQIFTKQIEANSGNEKAYYNRGLSYAMLERYGQALEDFEKAISLNPQYTLAYTNRGIVYMFLKEYGRADEDFNRAIELDPKYPGIYYNKSCLYALMNYIEQSCLWLRMAIEHGYNDWGHVKTDSDLANIRDSSCYKALMNGK